MKKLFKFKYKIYRRFNSDLWGLVILKKKKDNLFKFILNNFEYVLKKFYRKQLKLNINDGLIKNMKKVLKNKRLVFFQKNKFNKILLNLCKINVSFENKIKNKQLLLLKWSYRLFWIEFFDIYINFFKNTVYNDDNTDIDLNNNYLFSPLNNFTLSIKTIFLITYLTRKLFFLNKKRGKLFKRFSNVKRLYKFDIYDHLSVDYILPSTNIYQKKKRSAWWNVKIEQDKTNIFFGFFTKQKFLKFQNICFFSNKLRFCWLLKLVGRLNFILFNFNFYSDMYYIYNFIRKGYMLVNNKTITNPNYFVNLFDNISFTKQIFKKLILLFKFRLQNNQILINYPVNYMEINYTILTASIWCWPNTSDIIGPYEFPFKSFSHDWLLYKNKI